MKKSFLFFVLYIIISVKIEKINVWGLGMRITTRGRYALRALLAMARLRKDGGPVSISIIAEEEKISAVILEQIFFKLRKAGIVSSVRGPGGGFCFARPMNKLTVKEILDAAGEDLAFRPCNKHHKDCKRINRCASHDVWTSMMDMVNDYLRSLTMASLLERQDDLEENEAS
jgi:Rrf2 family iron-sulfur cluster assembly transcriptional regulator